MEHIVKRRNSIVGHIVRMPHTVPAHQALHCQDELSLGRLHDSSWKRCPGRPNERWLDQIHDDNRPPADVWRDAITRGHSGATQQSTPTYRRSGCPDLLSILSLRNQYQLQLEGKGRYGSFRRWINVGCAGETVRSLACHTLAC